MLIEIVYHLHKQLAMMEEHFEISRHLNNISECSIQNILETPRDFKKVSRNLQKIYFEEYLKTMKISKVS